MTGRRLSVCRWCGTEPAPSTDPSGRGRPPTFCSPDHRRAFHRTFGGPTYDGAVQITEDCGRACALDGQTVALPGPVRAPGGWADAVQGVAELLHGHAVSVRVEPIETAGDALAWSSVMGVSYERVREAS